MEAEVFGPVPALPAALDRKGSKESVRVKRKSLQAVLEQCQRALEALSNNQDFDDDDDDEEEEEEEDDASSSANLSRQSSVALRDDNEADEVRSLQLPMGF